MHGEKLNLSSTWCIHVSLDLSWTSPYFRDPVSALGSYTALLLLRFERRSNYERVFNIDEFLSQAKSSLRNLLGSSAADRAYESGVRFLEDFFRHFPEALQAKPRARLLEAIESFHYDTLRRYYLASIISEVSKLERHEKFLLCRIVESIRSGKVPLIDRTSCGSTYMLKVDLLYHAAGVRDVEHVAELQYILACSGVLLPEYTRIIVPAPLTDNLFLRQLTRTDRELELTQTVTRRLAALGYTYCRTYSLASATGKMLVLELRKKILGKYSAHIRIYIAPRQEIDTPSYTKILQDTNTPPRPNLSIVICKSVSENVRRCLTEQAGVIAIELGDVDTDKARTYIAETIVKILLEFSATSALHETLSFLQDLYTVLLG